MARPGNILLRVEQLQQEGSECAVAFHGKQQRSHISDERRGGRVVGVDHCLESLARPQERHARRGQCRRLQGQV